MLASVRLALGTIALDREGLNLWIRVMATVGGIRAIVSGIGALHTRRVRAMMTRVSGPTAYGGGNSHNADGLHRTVLDEIYGPKRGRARQTS